MFTEKIRHFFQSHNYKRPILAIDLDIIRQKIQEFKKVFAQDTIYYAVKANPDPKILSLLNQQGAYFDVASRQEAELCFSIGIAPEKISFSNTIKKIYDIESVYNKGVRLFSTDSISDVEKLNRYAPDARIMVRILCDSEGAQWPLSKKFGCSPDMASALIKTIHHSALQFEGIAFHVGSQQNMPSAWNKAIETSALIAQFCQKNLIPFKALNIGGGFPTAYSQDTKALSEYYDVINQSLSRYFPKKRPEIMVEPGRAIVAEAGVICSQIVMIARKTLEQTETPWMFLDIGVFGGLIETMDEAIRYPISTYKDDAPKIGFIMAGPTCDSVDILYQNTPYMLPQNLQERDFIFLEQTGAYTTTYSSVAFNGFEPLDTIILE